MRRLIMEERLVSSEMPVSESGGTYHLGLSPGDNLPQNIFLVGDPNRVFKMVKYFDTEPVIKRSMQFVTAIGSYQNLPIAAIGTGIGPSATEIVANELHILNEYDASKKEWKKQLRRLNIIRLGSCAALQKEIPVGSLAISRLAVGLDNLNRDYPFYSPSSVIRAITEAVANALEKPDVYVSSASNGMEYFLTEACKNIGLSPCGGKGYYSGITLSSPGFYNPQNRRIGRLPEGLPPNALNVLNDFQCYALKIINVEMESAIMFRILGEILGYRTGTLCAVLANRQTKEVFSPEEGEAAINRCIRTGLEAMKLMSETSAQK